MQANVPVHRLRFGLFEVDLRAGELTKQGQRLKLQEQPFQVLAMLLEKPYQARFNPSILMRPAFDPLRSDSRFQALLRRIGL